jgi:predicted aspartyl protease
MKHQGIARKQQRLLVALMIFITHASVRGFDTPEITGTIPFHVREHLIIVQGSADELRDLNLVLDTGSTYTVLSKEVGKRLGLKGETVKVTAFGREVNIKKVTVGRLVLGETEFEQVEARVADLPRVAGMKLDGLIGLDVLRRTAVTLDFTREELVLGRVRDLSNSTRFYSGLPFIPVTMTVNGKALRLSLDTGACGLLLYDGAAIKQFQIHRTNRVEYRDQVGGRIKMQEIALSDVAFANSSWGKLPAYLINIKQSGNENVMGNLGVIPLGLKILQFDFETGQLGWEL